MIYNTDIFCCFSELNETEHIGLLVLGNVVNQDYFFTSFFKVFESHTHADISN